jgi:hypothetical protein
MVTKGFPTKDSALTEQFFGQVSESLQLVFDLTSRIDERVKMLMEKQRQIDEQIEKLINLQHNLEIKAETLSNRVGNHDNRWAKVIDIVWKLSITIIAGIILYKLGIK